MNNLATFMPWWGYSLLASVIWGIQFNIVARLSSSLPQDGIMTAITVYFLPTIPLLIFLPLYYDKLFVNLKTLVTTSPALTASVVAMMFTSIIATICLYIAVHSSKNATMAGLMDITYPLFVALFAWLLFGEQQLTTNTAIGGLFIVIGAGFILWKQ